MTLDEIARTYGIEDQVRDMPDLRPARHWAMPVGPRSRPSGRTTLRCFAANALRSLSLRTTGASPCRSSECPSPDTGARKSGAILIAVAVFCIVYFAGQMLRAVLP